MTTNWMGDTNVTCVAIRKVIMKSHDALSFWPHLTVQTVGIFWLWKMTSVKCVGLPHLMAPTHKGLVVLKLSVCVFVFFLRWGHVWLYQQGALTAQPDSVRMHQEGDFRATMTSPGEYCVNNHSFCHFYVIWWVSSCHAASVHHRRGTCLLHSERWPPR